ncbi:class I SAM-dependent methyltransferase [Candidatus Curtissbacteria bacterium]|nr:class I SAM-dependent methyltransferase [Candidatus Curtissbacteria bacterium]
MIATYLAHTSTKRNVIGWDTNLKRINLANKSASKSPNLKFEAKNALSRMPKVDAVILSDFIHHVPKKFHQKLFTNIYSSLKKGGVMVIKEINTQDLVRAKISRIFDFAFYPKDKIFFLNAQHLTSDLEKIGFKVKRQKVKKLFPGSTNLFICTK